MKKRSTKKRFSGRRAQGAIEYLSIVGIALMVLIPATILFLNYSKSTSDGVIANQLNFAGLEIYENAEKMFVIGKGSWVTLEINMPDSYKDGGIVGNNEMFFTYSTSQGESQAVFFFDKFYVSNGRDECNSYCDLSFNPGVNRVRIESNGTTVFIRKMS